MSRAANNTKPVGTKAAQRAMELGRARFDAGLVPHDVALHVKHVVPKYDFDRAPEVDAPGGTYVGIVESLEAELMAAIGRNGRLASTLYRLSGYCEETGECGNDNPTTPVLSHRLFAVVDGLRRERERGSALLDALGALV